MQPRRSARYLQFARPANGRRIGRSGVGGQRPARRGPCGLDSLVGLQSAGRSTGVGRFSHGETLATPTRRGRTRNRRLANCAFDCRQPQWRASGRGLAKRRDRIARSVRQAAGEEIGRQTRFSSRRPGIRGRWCAALLRRDGQDDPRLGYRKWQSIGQADCSGRSPCAGFASDRRAGHGRRATMWSASGTSPRFSSRLRANRPRPFAN